MRAALARLRPCRAQHGFTLVEVLVAVVVVALGVLGLIGAFDSARRLSLLSERRTAMAHRAQFELERLQTYPLTQLAMITAPAHSSEASNPDYYVNYNSPLKCKPAEHCYAWDAEQKTEEETLVLLPTGKEGTECATLEQTECGRAAASPTGRKCAEKVGACEWSDGPLKGNVYDFVTYHTDNAIKQEKAYIRLTVVVTSQVPSGSHEPTALRVSTLLAEP